MAIQFPALSPLVTALVFVLAVVAAFIAGILIVFMSKIPKSTVTKMVEDAYDRGYAHGREDATTEIATGEPVEGTVINPREGMSEWGNAIADHWGVPETVIASSGYRLVKWEPEPDPLSDTWLQEQLAALGTWSENQEHKLWRWAHALATSGHFTNTDTGAEELCSV